MLHTLKTTANSNSKKNAGTKSPRRTDVMDIFDGNVRIFRTTNSGDVWQFQMYVKDEQRYIRKSLKTRDKEVAIGLAQKEFIFYQAKLFNGQKLFSITADELRTKYLEYVDQLVEDGQLSAGRRTNIKTFTKHYVEFVGKSSKIQNIDRKFFQGYRAFRQKKKADITMTVVQNETITIKQLYNWAKDNGLIDQTYQLDFGKIKADKNEVRREGYLPLDYTALVDVAKFWYRGVAKDNVKREEEIYYRKTIRDFIVLMANFGFRTQELRLLKWKDVRIQSGGNVTITVRSDTTKVRTQREVGGKKADVFERRKTYSKHCEPDDYVFGHYRKHDVITKELLYEYYNALLVDVKKKHKDFDDSKTLYGLRHFFITVHLLAAKVDVYKIARFCGTSILQIQRHYDNVKDKQVSDEIRGYVVRFDDDGNVFLQDE